MAEKVPMMNCGDGFRRAKLGSLFNDSRPLAKAATGTLTADDSGKCITNTGATGAITLSLPTAKHGMNYIFANTVAQVMTIAATGGATINAGAPNGSIAGPATIGANCWVFAVGGNWMTSPGSGAWA